MIFFRYETPMFSILNKGEDDEAKKILRRIYFEYDVNNIVQYIKDSNKGNSEGERNQGFYEAMFGQRYWKATWVGILFQCFNAFCGINVIILYSSKIFE